MNEKAGGLSSMFNWKSLAWGLGMFLASGMVDFILFHEHPLGQAMIELVKDPLLNFFDFFANTFGLAEFARNPAFLTSSGVACAASIDPVTLMPIPCGP